MSLVEFVTIWFSESRLNFSNLAPYAGRSWLASFDWRIIPVLYWSKLYKDKSRWSDWHHNILSCPRITSNIWAKSSNWSVFSKSKYLWQYRTISAYPSSTSPLRMLLKIFMVKNCSYTLDTKFSWLRRISLSLSSLFESDGHAVSNFANMENQMVICGSIRILNVILTPILIFVVFDDWFNQKATVIYNISFLSPIVLNFLTLVE